MAAVQYIIFLCEVHWLFRDPESFHLREDLSKLAGFWRGAVFFLRVLRNLRDVVIFTPAAVRAVVDARKNEAPQNHQMKTLVLLRLML
ncbi:hypothetical protein NDU88_011377 [Pleurodeles waltl]|uniref:Uncharacterized protein n=1 Tax=Pleurodeles waltl TaxID=8319 RepID=A0AAV7R368_PLEWA|nr:hypothetical protein NDU88_011377 [Pleurodeles waltl]